MCGRKTECTGTGSKISLERRNGELVNVPRSSFIGVRWQLMRNLAAHSDGFGEDEDFI